jgi:hypothetical protein
LHRSGYKPGFNYSPEPAIRIGLSSMDLPPKVLLAANTLIHRHGNGAEE